MGWERKPLKRRTRRNKTIYEIALEAFRERGFDSFSGMYASSLVGRKYPEENLNTKYSWHLNLFEDGVLERKPSRQRNKPFEYRFHKEGIEFVNEVSENSLV